MRLATSPRILHVGRDDKEAKLKDFIVSVIPAGKSRNSSASLTEITVIARAPDSPVAVALAALAPQIANAGIQLRAIVLDTETGLEDPARAALLDMKGIEVRLLQDLRFAAAHEQLVLGASRLWIGDCMRRDPAKRDAFEVFHHDDAKAANHARVSFSRLWKLAKPVKLAQKPVTTQQVIAGQKTVKNERRPASRR